MVWPGHDVNPAEDQGMPQRPLNVAIVGAGIGGLTAAACLRRVGVEEDAAVLSRCLANVDRDGATALKQFERPRLDRAASIQPTSARNTWLRGCTNADRVYGYDAWTTPLA